MANHARGEADLTIAGKTYSVSMSMGALAEMASALGVESMQDLSERILKFHLTDMPNIVAAALKGNGYDVPIEDINRMDPMDYFNRVIPAFFRTDADAKPANGDGDARPPKRQKA
jgi:Phage tail tube protein, GTA-gp10